ncbi:flagellar biosynthetic protein FliR [Candidatus Ferrigenium straubiae]|jgi:flagellar biosynthetic protein FliR|uniref:flagellar biosynthetic protein FliR n=1 Tax=Candidatus Ferrigenium straubiae TaxID=2919506 RepID=UPI003F4ACF93
MISFTSAQLDVWLATLIFPLTRILAMIASSPVLGNKQVPARVKIGLSVMLAIIIAPTLGEMPPVAIGSPQGLLIIIQQVIIGVAMGFTMRLIFTAVEMAGELAGLQMGLGFASFYDPVNAGHSPIIAQWLGMIAALAFLALNGHLYMLSALAESFHTLPIGSMMSARGFYEVASWGGSIFAYGLQISLPLLAALLTANIALGILTRAAPQLNLFAIGFPITLAIGFLVLALSMPHFTQLLDRFTQEGLGTMLNLVKQPH